MRRTRLAAALAVLSLACACQSEPEGKGGPKQSRVEKPFISCFEAIEKPFLPGGAFPPGEQVVLAPLHRGPHAALFFLALRGRQNRHVHAQTEETLFVYAGTGKLLLEDGRKEMPIEAGNVVRVPPGVCHGYQGSRDDPLKAIMITTPRGVLEDPEKPEKGEKPDYVETSKDAPGNFYAASVLDVQDPDKTIPPLPAVPKGSGVAPFVQKKVLDDTSHSALSVVAIRHGKITDHIHKQHDETVIIFAQQGVGFLRLAEVVHPVEQSTIAYIPAGCVHSFEHQGAGHSRAVSIYAEGGGAQDVMLVTETAASIDPTKPDDHAPLQMDGPRNLFRPAAPPKITAPSRDGPAEEEPKIEYKPEKP